MVSINMLEEGSWRRHGRMLSEERHVSSGEAGRVPYVLYLAYLTLPYPTDTLPYLTLSTLPYPP